MKILVAEDNPESRYLLQKLFTGLGHEVAAVADGLEVLELLDLARSEPPDVIVSDALMPRMDGFQLCRALRQHPQWCAMPFIFYTATYTDDADERFALRVGADRFVVKPVDPSRLMEMVEETVRQVRAAPPRTPVSLTDDTEILEEYTRRLSLKLELKVVELEGANEDLRASEKSIRDLNAQLTRTVQELQKEIQERKAAQAELGLREEVLRQAQRLGQIGSYVRSAHDTRMVWSDEAYRICGVEPGSADATREWLLERIHPEDRERVLRQLRAADERMDGLEIEHRIVRPDGSVRQVQVRRHVYRDAQGNPERVIGIIQDITERRDAEQQRMRLEAQLRQAQKMEAIGNLAGGIAHDFNNVLTAIMSHAELLELELPREGGAHLRESAHEISAAAARAREMVRQILTFSRKQPVDRKPLDIDRVVGDAVRIARAALPATVEVHSDLKTHRSVLANESQIHQVVLNLCVNAAQSLGEHGGPITITLSRAELPPSLSRGPGNADGHVLLRVSDRGCGMDAATLERIFEPFFTTKNVGEGTGLGLAVVHGIVEAHDGAISVESQAGEGTTFSIYLPALPAIGEEQTSVPAGPPTGRGERVLFVDDEPSVAKIGARLLERLGYRVVALTDATVARDRLVNNPAEFDLVVTDYLMPRVTGVDLAKAVWAVRPDLPMILAVGFGGQLDASKAKAFGFREFVAKPFALQTLAQAMARTLGR